MQIDIVEDFPKKNRAERGKKDTARGRPVIISRQTIKTGRRRATKNGGWNRGNRKREKGREGDIRKEWRNGEKGNENEAGTVASEV